MIAMGKNLAYLILALTINHAFAQITADQCPKSVMIGNDTYDMAGDIRSMGSAQAVLSKINETIQRELPAICSAPRSRSRAGQIEDMLIRNDQRACETARARLMGMKAAVEACIASVNSRPKAPVPGNITPSASASPGASPSTSADGGIDRSLFNTEDNSDGNAIFRKMAAAGTPFVPKNPQHDHTGEPCSYFTQPLVRPDGGGLNAYADGSAVAYGKFYYLCENRRWVRLGPTSAFSNTHEVTAELLESRARPVQVYEKE